MTEPETAELVRALAGTGVSDSSIQRIHRRGNGNPFFIRELARLLGEDGTEALAAVPPGVRDVVRHRLSRLPDRERTVLRQASVIGVEVDAELLTELSGDPEGVLAALDSASRAGFVTESDSATVIFAHALVRDVVYRDIPALRRSLWHARAGELLELHDATGHTLLAHHFVSAATRSTAARAARHATAAARAAEQVFAPHEAARWWAAAVTAYDRLGGTGCGREPASLDSTGRDIPHPATEHSHAGPGRPAKLDAGADGSTIDGSAVDSNGIAAQDMTDFGVVPEQGPGRGPAVGVDVARERVVALAGLIRALAVTGRLGEARRYRAEALGAVRDRADPELTARAVVAFDVPAVWTDTDDPQLADQVVAAAEWALRELPDADRELRFRLLTTIALELRAADTARGRTALAEAENLASQLERPSLLALVRNARFMQTFSRAGLAAERARIGDDLIELARVHDLVTFEVLGRLIRLHASSALADFDAADAAARAADALAERYGLPLVGVFTGWYSALRQSITATSAEAEAAYRSASAAFPPSAMPGLAHGLLPLALLCVRLRHGLPVDPDPNIEWGPHEPWVRPLILIERGLTEQARDAVAALPDPPADLLLELRLCLLARAALALGERPLMRRIHHRLLPAAGELAGAGSGLVTLEPVDHYLALLAAALAE